MASRREIIPILFLAGCIHMQSRGEKTAALSPATCSKLDTEVMATGLLAVLVGGAAGSASTLSGVFDDPAVRYSLVGASALLSITGGVTGYLSGYYASKFSKGGCQ